MNIFIKQNKIGVITEYTHYNFSGFKEVTLPLNYLEQTNLIGWKFKDGIFIKPLKILQEEKKDKLKSDYNYSKRIILQNGNTLVINHDTPERKFFTDNLENLKRIEQAENSVLSYWQEVDGVLLGFSALSYIWKYLFLNKFTNKKPSLTLEAKRNKNKEILDLKKLKIENATSIEELEGIDWSFENFTIININLEAKKLIDDPKTPTYVIEAIKNLQDKDGQIHLIKEL